MQIRKEKFDYKGSGTTCIIIIQLEEKIICANTGDSRAIIVYDKSSSNNNNNKKNILGNSKVFPLSYDCKPDLPNERKRIYEHGGVVDVKCSNYDFVYVLINKGKNKLQEIKGYSLNGICFGKYEEKITNFEITREGRILIGLADNNGEEDDEESEEDEDSEDNKKNSKKENNKSVNIKKENVFNELKKKKEELEKKIKELEDKLIKNNEEINEYKNNKSKINQENDKVNLLNNNKKMKKNISIEYNIDMTDYNKLNNGTIKSIITSIILGLLHQVILN